METYWLSSPLKLSTPFGSGRMRRSLQDVVRMDVRERRSLAAAVQVGVAVAALGTRAHREIGLGARRGRREQHQQDPGEGRGQLFCAHSVIQVRIAVISSALGQTAPPSGLPGQPWGIWSPEMPGEPSIFCWR